MNYFEALLEKLENAKPPQIVEVALSLNKPRILELVWKNQLLERNVNSKNDSIGVYAHDYELEAEFGEDPRGFPKVQGEPYNLLLTGTFKDTFKLKQNEKESFVVADGKKGKDEDIIKKYGEETIGFTDESMGAIPSIIEGDVQEIVLGIFRSV